MEANEVDGYHIGGSEKAFSPAASRSNVRHDGPRPGHALPGQDGGGVRNRLDSTSPEVRRTANRVFTPAFPDPTLGCP